MNLLIEQSIRYAETAKKIPVGMSAMAEEFYKAIAIFDKNALELHGEEIDNEDISQARADLMKALAASIAALFDQYESSLAMMSLVLLDAAQLENMLNQSNSN